MSVPPSILTGKTELIEFGIFPISKDRGAEDNGDITHAEPVFKPVSLIYTYNLPLLNYQLFNKVLNYIYMFVLTFKLNIKRNDFFYLYSLFKS
jgi:hypothetical protein